MKPTYHDSVTLWKDLLNAGLQDDGWPWDWTSLGCGEALEREVRAQIIAKSEGVWAADGLGPAIEAISRELEMPIRVRTRVEDGDKLKPGMVVQEWRGSARSVLALERPALNLASYAGGIATATRRLVDLVQKAWKKQAHRGLAPRVTATRKTLPSYRDLALHAVQAGGGWSHRVSLSGGVLIKENHIAAARGIARAVSGSRDIAPHGLKIEVEVRNLKELQQAIDADAEAVLLDNFEPGAVRQAVSLIQKSGQRIVVEVSGGLRPENIGDYVMPGVNILSVGGLTHSVQAIDLSLLVR